MELVQQNFGNTQKNLAVWLSPMYHPKFSTIKVLALTYTITCDPLIVLING